MVDIKAQKPAKRYSDAFFETLSGNYEKVLSEIDCFLEILKSNDFKNFILHPNVPLQDKKDLIKQAFASFSKETVNFILILLEENRLNCLDEIRGFLFEKINNKNNTKLVEVTLAIDPDDSIKEYITSRLQNKFKSNVLINFKKDSSLIAGIVFKIGDTLIDLSVKNKLDKFKQI